MFANGRYVLIVKCQDRRGIVAAISAFLAGKLASITEANQCDEDGIFFMRAVFVGDQKPLPPIEEFRTDFVPVAEEFAMTWEIHDMRIKSRVLIAVSRFGHCLFDLLHRWRAGLLPAEVVGVVSNHDDMRSFVEWNGLPYYHFPVDKNDKARQEKQILELVGSLKVELLVLARYMQILSPALCEALSGRCINIHHSFLPSFKGAKPYHQAHARGVKIIGATAHYVTDDLDEGPIIEQSTHRVNHGFSAERFAQVGQDVECYVLARAVTWHLERRVSIQGQKTIIFE